MPRPRETEWELELPDGKQEELVISDETEEDATVRDRRNAAIRKAAEIIEFNRKTQVMQRGLPIVPINKMDALAQALPEMDSAIKRAIVSEMSLLMVDDHKAKTELKLIDDELVERARSEIRKEEMRGQLPLFGQTLLVEYTLDIEPEPATFPLINNAIEKLAETGMAAEKKLALHHGGYHKRAKTLRQKVTEAAQALETARVESQVSRTAQIAEEAAIDSRLDQLREEVMVLNKREREAQEYYRLQKQELEDLLLPVTNGVH